MPNDELTHITLPFHQHLRLTVRKSGLNVMLLGSSASGACMNELTSGSTTEQTSPPVSHIQTDAMLRLTIFAGDADGNQTEDQD